MEIFSNKYKDFYTILKQVCPNSQNAKQTIDCLINAYRINNDAFYHIEEKDGKKVRNPNQYNKYLKFGIINDIICNITIDKPPLIPDKFNTTYQLKEIFGIFLINLDIIINLPNITILINVVKIKIIIISYLYLYNNSTLII